MLHPRLVDPGSTLINVGAYSPYSLGLQWSISMDHRHAKRSCITRFTFIMMFAITEVFETYHKFNRQTEKNCAIDSNQS